MERESAPASAASAGDSDAEAGGSLGYASRLSHRHDLGGGLGATEYLDSPAEVCAKAGQLVSLLLDASRVVVFTGAGISTSCGIPDFRGPSGVWTLQRKGLPPPRASVRFDQAYPSLTHMALVSLHAAGKLSLVVSQNVDCLHIRSGLPRAALAELHGNCFVEKCEACATEFVRDFEVPSVGLKRTGRACERCGAELRDQCLDWESALPEDEMELAERETARADLVLCLGTSLQITPACNMPTKATRRGGKLVIVNLQKTPKDRRAALVIRGRVDAVLARVMRALDLSVPPYVRTDRARLCHRVDARSDGSGARDLSVWLLSSHGPDAPLPWLLRCHVHRCAPTGGAEGSGGDDADVTQPLAAERLATLDKANGWRARIACAAASDGAPAAAGDTEEVACPSGAGADAVMELLLHFEFGAACTLREARVKHSFAALHARAEPPAPSGGGALPPAHACRELSFETVRHQHDVDAVIAASDVPPVLAPGQQAVAPPRPPRQAPARAPRGEPSRKSARTA